MSGFRHAYTYMKTQEWRPISLRQPWTLIYTMILALCVGLLQGLDALITRNHGIHAGSVHAVLALRYVPTVIAILIAFAWKRLVFDIATITPWAMMSNRWTTASDSVLLNYLDGLDITVAWTSFHKRHWAMFLASVCGLLAGALVPFANGLAQLKTGHEYQYQTTVLKDTQLVYGSSLLSPIDWRGQLSFETIVFLNNDDRVEWSGPNITVESMSFGDLPSTTTQVDTLVRGFSASLDCSVIEFNHSLNLEDFTLTIDLYSTNPMIGCDQPIRQRAALNTSGTVSDLASVAWANITSCNQEDDEILTFTLMAIKGANASTLHNNEAEIQMSALACRPIYVELPVEVVVDYSTKTLIDTNPLMKNRTIVDLGISNSQVFMLLQQPLFTYRILELLATNDYTTLGVLPNSVDWVQNTQLGIASQVAALFLYYPPLSTAIGIYTDWFLGILNVYPRVSPTTLTSNISLLEVLIDQPDLFESTLNQNFALAMTQQVHLLGRQSNNATINATVTVVDDRYYLRRSSLRLLQAILCILMVSEIMLTTIISPRSVLRKDPRSLAFIAYLLVTDSSVEAIFGTDKILSVENMYTVLSEYVFTLQAGTDGVALRASRAMASARKLDAQLSSLDCYETSKMALVQKPRDLPVEAVNARYRPLFLRRPLMYTLMSLLGMLILVNALLTILAVRLHGFQHSGPTLETLSAYGPSVVLVLAGYAIQSFHESYKKLREFYSLSRFHALLGQKLDVVLRGKREQTTTLIFVMLLLALPAVKLVVSGLFIPAYEVTTEAGSMSIDRAPFDQFVNSTNDLTQQTLADYSEDYAMQILVYNYSSLGGYTSYPEVLDSYNLPMVLTNFTEQMAASKKPFEVTKSTVDVNVPAFRTNVTCRQIDSSIFDLEAQCFANGTYTLTLKCSSQQCDNIFTAALEKEPYQLHGLTNASLGVSQFMTVTESDTENGPFAIVTGNFSALALAASVPPAVCANNGSKLAPGSLGHLAPDISAATCQIVMQRVNVDVTFGPRNPELIYQFTTSVPIPNGVDWIPRGYDATSVEVLETYQGPTLPPTALPFPFRALHRKAATPNLAWDTGYIIPLIAQYQAYTTGNPLDLFRNENLAASTAQVLRDVATYTTRALLVNLREDGVVEEGSLPIIIHHEETLPVQLSISRLVIGEDYPRAIVLSLLLFLILACVVYLASRVPQKTVLPRAPSSIANRLSLLAGSELVRRLRDEHNGDSGVSLSQEVPIGLGWWELSEPSRTQVEQVSVNSGSETVVPRDHEKTSQSETQEINNLSSRRLRWGIDVGDGLTGNYLTTRAASALSPTESAKEEPRAEESFSRLPVQTATSVEAHEMTKLSRTVRRPGLWSNLSSNSVTQRARLPDK